MNYAIPAVVFASAIIARAASRIVDAPLPGRISWPAALVVLAVMVSAYNHLYSDVMQRRSERAAAAKIFAHLDRPPSAFFFVDRPGFNRVGGAAGPGLRRLALSGLRVAAPGRGPLGDGSASRSGTARSAASWPRRPDSRIVGTVLDLRALGYHPRHQRRPVLRLDPMIGGSVDRPRRLRRSPPFRPDSPAVTIVGTRRTNSMMDPGGSLRIRGDRPKGR